MKVYSVTSLFQLCHCTKSRGANHSHILHIPIWPQGRSGVARSRW